MNVIWLSGRVVGNDLCATTQVALMDGISERGVHIRMYSPGEIDRDWHIPVNRSNIKGLQSRSVAKSILNLGIPDCDLVILDWRLAKWIIPRLQKENKKWLLMDRSPPADAGIFAKLQHKQWLNAWKQSGIGCVVSQRHADLINQQKQTKLYKIPAGVDSSAFLPRSPSAGLNLVYHGRLDKNRGVLSLLEITKRLNQSGIITKLRLVGEGDLSQMLYSMNEDWLDYKGKVSHSEIPNLLSEMDVGLSPMDGREVWAISSPLKIAEYAAAGLQVVATDQPGHHLSDNTEWLRLVDLENWIENAVNILSGIEERGNPVRDAAEIFDWRYSIDMLTTAIHETIEE